VQLYAVAGGYGLLSTPLIETPVLTGAEGQFSISGTFTCPSASTLVYLAAVGGNPGLAQGTNNEALVLLAGLGPCGELTPSTDVVINEVTTVAMVYSVLPYMASYTQIGAAAGGNASALANDFVEIDEFVNPQSGLAPGPALPPNFTEPVATLYTLADIIAACVNSRGGTSGDGSPCGNLFAASRPPQGGAPDNTAQAIWSIASVPTNNVAELFAMVPPNPPFEPTLTSAPPDWTLVIVPGILLSTESNPIGINTQQTGTVALAEAASAGLTVTLASSNAAFTIPQSVPFAKGQSSATFSYTASSPGITTITATAAGYEPGTLQVTADASVIVLGSLTTGTPGIAQPLAVSLTAPAAAGGVTVELASGNTAVASIQTPSVFIPAGATMPVSSPSVLAVAPGVATITATANGFAPDSTGITVGPVVTALPQGPTLLVEYPFYEGAGSVAHDVSGNGNDGTIAGAAWDGSTDLNITTPGGYVQLPAALTTGAKTLAFAAYFPYFLNDTDAANPPWQPPAYSTVGNGFLCTTGTSGPCWISTHLGTEDKSPEFYNLGVHNTGDSTEATSPMTTGWHTLIVDCGDPTIPLLAHIYFDGTEVQYYTQSDAMCGVGTGNLQIGGAGPYTWEGKIGFFAAWSSHLAGTSAIAAADSTMRSYIQAKGAVLDYTPENRTAPAVLCGIDSRTVGTGTNNGPWCQYLQLTDPVYTVMNVATAGTTLYDHCAMFNGIYKPYISPVAPTILVAWGGTNDMAHTTETPAQIEGYMQCIVQQAKQAGARVIIATEISGGVSSGCTVIDTARDVFNPVVRSSWQSWGADNLVDLATLPQLGADGDCLDSYYADYEHPNDAGEALITPLMNDAINELLGSTAANPSSTSAAAYQEVAGDLFLNLEGGTAQTITLPSCVGYAQPRHIANFNSQAATLATLDGQVLTGSPSVSSGTTAIIAPVPGPSSTAGCSWSRTQ
jgi:hypothetical protein